MPIIPLTILNHKIWAYVDSGATFNIFDAKEAKRLGLELKRGTYQMIVVGDGSFIPTYFHEVPICIDDVEVIAQVGFSERLGVGFNLLGRRVYSIISRYVSVIRKIKSRFNPYKVFLFRTHSLINLFTFHF